MSREIQVLGSTPHFDVRLEDDYTQIYDNEILSRSDSLRRCEELAQELIALPLKPGKVVSIYGIGGQGKTHLMEGLRREFQSQFSSDAILVHYDFSVDAVTSSETIVKNLANRIVDAGIPCPRLFATYYAWRAKVADERAARKEFSDDLAD